MRGFLERATVAATCDWVDSHAVRRGWESVPLAACAGRVLAADATASMDVPPFDRAAMDGYALRARETEGAGDYAPLEFRVLGASLPGHPFRGEVVPHAAVRIMTGAPMPAGADAVIPAEFAPEAQGHVQVTSAVTPGKHVGLRGEDVTHGACLLKSGRRLRPQDVGLLASVGLAQADVVKRPRVRILVTGDELALAGQSRDEFQIYDSNSVMLRALVERDGGELEATIHCPDDRNRIRDALARPGADVVLVSGGSSVGVEDHAPSIVAAEGELAIHGIAMRPSSPTGIGRFADALVFLLPGNPVSCLCAYDFFAGRAVRLMGGRSPDWPYPSRPMTVARKIVSAIGRVDYCRVRITGEQVEPIALSGASILSSTTRADGFHIVPGECEGYAPGTTVSVYSYDPFS